jgi:hypothetical protein
MMPPSESTATFNSRLVSNPDRDAQHTAAPRMWSGYTSTVVAKLREIAPYAAMELVLPGGSLMALVLWLYRRRCASSKDRQRPETSASGGSLDWLRLIAILPLVPIRRGGVRVGRT